MKRISSQDRELGQSTYETSSGEEEDEAEDESEEEDQTSRANHNAPKMGGSSQELGYTQSPVSAPTRSEDDGVEARNENGEPHSPALRSRRADFEAIASSDDAASKNSRDDGSPAEDLQTEPVQLRKKQKIQRTFAQQHLRDERHPESPGLRDAAQHDEGIAPVRMTTSDQDTSSPSSIFDLVQDSALVDDKHLQSADLKRKRRSADERISNIQGQPTRKRRKRSIFSPPTSVPPEEEGPTEPSSGLKAIQGRFKINRPVAKQKPTVEQMGRDQESVATWVKPLSHNTSLKHPLFNPSPLKRPFQSHATDLAIQSGKTDAASSSGARRRSSRKSGTRKADFASLLKVSSNDEAPTIHKMSRTVFTSPKGKSRAKLGVNYSSPPPEARDRATNLSTSKKVSGKARPVAPKPFADDDGSLDHGVEQRSMEDSDSGSNANISDRETDESVEGSSTPKKLTCKTCSRKFRVEQQLRIHKKNNVTHVRLYECGKCREEFDDKTSLLRHQSRKNHPRETFHAERKGPFSENEIRKLERFMVDYCDEHGIDETVFRQMMTDSSRRGREVVWSWPGVTRFEFLNEYYDVLPDRAHKSMQRYKERNFQNLDNKKEWTEEDDKLLLELVDELGHKWTEIGLRLTRTQDSVTTRYKKKLKNRDAAQSGEWSSRENDALRKVIEDMKDELGLEKTPETDANIVWTGVSERMGGIRTAHQCSTHWHRVLKPKQEPRRQSTEGRRSFKSKEVVSSDDDNKPANMADKPRRERSVGVSIAKKAKWNAHQMQLGDSSESDSNEQNTQQDNEDVGSVPRAAIERQASPELGSSDWGEQDGTPSPSEADSDDAAERADLGDDFSEPVERTADEWERILAAEESLYAPAATSLDRSNLESQGSKGGHENRVREVMLETPSRKMKGPVANSKASRNPLNKNTPGRVMALSQAFEETQAPTSMLRQFTPIGLELPASNSSRPSPDIGVRLRPDLSQNLGTSQQQDGRQRPFAGSDENEIKRDVEMEGAGASSGESDRDTDMEDVTESSHDSRRPDRKQADPLEDAGPEDSDGEEKHSSAQSALSHSTDHEESRPMVSEDAETSEDDDASEEDEESEDESGSGGDTSKSEYESAATEGSDDEDEIEDSNDSMVKDTHNDFMANIKESAKQSQLQSPEVPRRTTKESDDESD